MPRFLSDKAIENLRYYKYSSVDLSLLVKWFLGAFWNWIVSWFPLWLAPNLITTIGFLILSFNFGALWYYSPLLDKPMPSPWWHLSFAVAIFLYQILDNCDGRQARRTKSSSPLGELVDHGCDSFFPTMSLCMMAVAWADHITAWHYFYLLNVGIIGFYFAHWEEWHTGTLILSTVGNPTEIQLLMVLAPMLTFFLGTEWWADAGHEILGRWSGLDLSFSAPVLQYISGYGFVFLLTSLGGIISMACNWYKVVQTAREKNISLLKAHSIMGPVVSQMVFTTAWFYLSPANVLVTHTMVCIAFYGLMTAYTLDHMMIDRITKIDFNIFNPFFLLPIIGFFHAISFGSVDPNRDVIALYACTLVILLTYIHMIYNVVLDLADALNIRVFVIPVVKN